ncbi:hypothetical protein PIROE2DRAFT_18116 [Piromyces sp. E2]|nr:hypothetical protein PIROE2DRAFT_18116 [Piromyces sp. E2]|eukprot:OUM57024.1 hypothetical protein PIROE2DRAFT_18116 [Piromyces sp. E2]
MFQKSLIMFITNNQDNDIQIYYKGKTLNNDNDYKKEINDIKIISIDNINIDKNKKLSISNYSK